MNALEPASRFTNPSVYRWTMRLLALIGLGLSTLLLYQEISGGLTLPGCGGGSGCETVFQSGWGRAAGIPVAAFGFAIYALLLAALANIGPSRPHSQRRLAWTLLLFAAAAVVGSALWFAAVQVFIIGAVCKYCMATHAVGLILATMIFAGFALRRATGITRRTTVWLAVLGLAAAATLAAVEAGTRAPTFRVVSYGDLGINIARYPVIGSRQAKHILVLFGDYTCPFCRRMSHDLDAAIAHFGRDQLAVAVAPMPLDAKCNRYVSETLPIHEGGCELAKIALVVWRLKPAAFSTMDHWLFAADHKRSVKGALAKAAQLVGNQAAIKREIAKPWTTQFVHAQVELNRRIGQTTKVAGQAVGDRIPKLIISRHFLIVGAPDSRQALFRELASQLHLQPRSP